MTHTLLTRFSSEPRRDGTEDLVILLHGYGSHELDLLGLAPMLPEGLCLAALRAPLPAGPGFAWFPLSQEVGFSPAAVERVAAAVESAVDDDVRPSDFRSVTLLGFSQGMAMATVLAQRAAFPVDALVGLSGFWIAQGEDRSREDLPVFWGRGLADAVIPASLVQETERALSGRSGAVVKTYAGLPHSISPQEMKDVSAFLTDALPR